MSGVHSSVAAWLAVVLSGVLGAGIVVAQAALAIKSWRRLRS